MPSKPAALRIPSDTESLRRRLEEAEETLRAIQGGLVDAIVVHTPKGDQIFTLKSADLPYRLLVEAMTESALIVNPKGVILHANGSFGRLLGRPMSQVLGAPIDKFAPSEARARLASLLQKGAKDSAVEELPLMDRTGNLLPSRVSVSRMTVEDTPALSVVVTDLRTREENREHVSARQRLSFLVEASRLLTETLDPFEMLDLIARLALNGIADWCAIDLKEENGELRRATITHRDPAKTEWAKAYVRDFPALDETNASYLTFRSGESILYPEISPEEIGNRNPRPHLQNLVGKLGLVSAMVVPMKARHETIGAITLVSAQPRRLYGEGDLHMAESLAIRAGLALENSKLFRQAQDAVASREQFLSVASHELRTPLTSLQIQLQLALRKLRQAQQTDVLREVTPMVASAESQSQNLVQLIDRLLDMTSIRVGKISLERERMDFDEILRSVLDRFQGQLLHSGTPLRTRVTPVAGLWDKMRIEQIVTNLVSNAIKFGAGKPIEVTLRAEEGRAKLTVRDSGVGMEPEFLQRVFKPFEQGRQSNEYRGLGLGLYITQQLVLAHGGAIRVESVRGAGTTFTVELPLEPPARAGR